MKCKIAMKEKYVVWLLYFILAGKLFVDCIWLHYTCEHSILISSLWINPLAFFSFYLPKLFISLFFASFVFFVKNKWSIVIYSVVLSIWFLANCVYFRSYGIYIDAFALTLVGNMGGFWGSVLLFIEWEDILYFVSSALLAVVVLCVPNVPQRKWKSGMICVLLSYIFCGLVILLPNYVYQTRYSVDNERYQYSMPDIKALFTPFSKSARTIGMGVSLEYDFSILHYIGFNIVDIVSVLQDKQNPYVFTKSDTIQLQFALGGDTCKWNGHQQIIIIVESLESWAIIPEVMPNVYKLLKQSNFYAPYCKNQTKGGGSADGQMIVNTGLLPIKEDAVCFKYPHNVFPSYPKGKSATIIPHPINVWNQAYMSVAYGYDTTIVCASNDELLFSKAIEMLDEGYDMLQILTLVSHAPFVAGKNVEISLPTGLPSTLHDYLGCLHLTDKGIGMLLNKIQSDTTFSDVTICITGDHTIFPIERRNQYTNECVEHGIDYSINEAFVPIIICSPSITSNILYTDTCYQMDIYPTMMDAMGYKNHYWKGVGTSLLEPNRNYDELEASDISDKLIRANYFSK